ncbi:hypothetical protein Htur_2608 [Haloterrigena turkmenica DSM 5511]|uniref:Uncharacterized protein n=1 Tax=Haloterrigena turkmenica (strain ATCC 51198 / DSM 5511 / JCM 9101 / NCIMB 13204 / VKM B-1734 / 4k) TaxID=543526 RepID=D2RW56_HALTV|nr:hypothetical protein Htur_2608 [Haloterrigena turkmenica DSM 5511]
MTFTEGTASNTGEYQWLQMSKNVQCQSVGTGAGRWPVPLGDERNSSFGRKRMGRSMGLETMRYDSSESIPIGESSPLAVVVS